MPNDTDCTYYRNDPTTGTRDDALVSLIDCYAGNWPQRRLQAIAYLHLMGEAVAAAETLSR